MKIKLDTLANIAALGTCAAIVVTLYVRPSPAASPQPYQGPKPYTVGERMSPLPGANMTAAPRTLFLALRHDCIYCHQNLPFYKTLIEGLEGQSSRQVQLVMITSDDKATAQSYVETKGLSFAQIVPTTEVALRDLRVPGTPTLILTDQQGRIEGVWIGRLDDARQREVLDKVLARKSGAT